MGIIIDGTTGIDLGHTPVNNGTNVEVEGNLNLSGVGARITGDFSNATIPNRVAFQTSTTNGDTRVSILPNGTSTNSSIQVKNSQDATNCSLGTIDIDATTVTINSAISGTGSYLPITLKTGGAERMKIDTSGNVGIGNIVDNNTRRLAFNNISGGTSAIESMTMGPTYQDLVFKTTYVTESEKMRLTGQGNLLLTSGTGGLGYGTGAGGTVTQLTSKSTPVTLNKPTGTIITHNASLAAGASVAFVMYNNLVGSPCSSIATCRNGNYDVKTSVTVDGSVYFILKNMSGVTLSEQIYIDFLIFKGANS